MYETQIEWIHTLQNNPIEWLNSFLIFCNHLDSVIFYSLVSVIVWMGYRRKVGIELLALALISGLLNHIVKNFYDMPRPLQVDPSVGLVSVLGFGFPSGASQLATFWGIYFIYKLRQFPLAWVGGIAYILFMGFVRVYIGAHFITDIMMGWFVGGVEAFCYILFAKQITGKIESLSPQARLGWMTLTVAIVVGIFCKFQTIRYFAIMFGFILGIFLDEMANTNMPDPKSFWEGVVRAIFSVAQQILILVALLSLFYLNDDSSAPQWVQLPCIFIAAVWISYITPMVNRAISRQWNKAT